LKKCLILANGKPPGKSVINFLKNNGYRYLICADGGADYARKLGIMPDLIAGDLDSITKENKKFFGSKTKILKLSGQNDTDVEKCIKLAVKKGFKEAMLLGVTGNRLDHTICNLGIVLKFYSQIKLKIIAEHSLLMPCSGKVTLKTIPGETISLFGFNRRTKITSSGLKYQLNNSSLPFGEKESTSNLAHREIVNLDIKGGVIFVIRDFDVVSRNGLL
jgi:thiamine pyrophosphokinase